MDLQAQLDALKTKTLAALQEFNGNHGKELQDLKVAVLGKKVL